MPGAENFHAPPTPPHFTVSLAYPTDSDQEGAGVLSDHLLTTRLSAPILPHGGTAKFSLEQWRENCCQVRPWRTLRQCGSMINSLVLHDLPWNLNSLYPPYAAPTKLIYIVSSDYTFSLGSCYLDTSYFSYFDPNAPHTPSPLRLSFMSHLKFTVFNIYPRSFPPWIPQKNAHIFSFMHIIHPI